MDVLMKANSMKSLIMSDTVSDSRTLGCSTKDRSCPSNL